MTRLLPHIEITKDEKGVTYLCLSRRDVPLAAVRIYSPGGEAWEPVEYPGLVELTEGLLNEGPAGTTPMDWHRRLDRDAMSMRAGFEEKHWWGSTSVLSEDLEEALSLLGQWLSKPGLPRSEWRRLVKTERAGAREAWAQPSMVIGHLARAQSLGFEHVNARFSYDKSFAHIKYDEARALGEQAFRKGTSTFALIAGDVDENDGVKHLRQLVDALPVSEPNEPPLPEETEPKPSSTHVWMMDHRRIDQAFFALSRPGIRAGDPDRIALRLANYALGEGGFSSRLMKRVREEMGHTYGISSSLPEAYTFMPFTIQSFTQVENLGAMLKLIDAEVSDIAASGFTEEEVSDARENAFGSLPLRLTNPASVLQYVLNGLQSGLDVEVLESDWHAIRETSRETVNAAARRLIGDGRFHLALIGPAEKILPQVQANGEATVFPFKTTPKKWPKS